MMRVFCYSHRQSEDIMWISEATWKLSYKNKRSSDDIMCITGNSEGIMWISEERQKWGYYLSVQGPIHITKWMKEDKMGYYVSVIGHSEVVNKCSVSQWVHYVSLRGHAKLLCSVRAQWVMVILSVTTVMLLCECQRPEWGIYVSARSHSEDFIAVSDVPGRILCVRWCYECIMSVSEVTLR